jgi:hypothetical protein
MQGSEEVSVARKGISERVEANLDEIGASDSHQTTLQVRLLGSGQADTYLAPAAGRRPDTLSRCRHGT